MYANFGSKEQLFMEVVAAHRSRAAARRIEQVTQILDEALASGADPFDALTGMFVKAPTATGSSRRCRPSSGSTRCGTRPRRR